MTIPRATHETPFHSAARLCAFIAMLALLPASAACTGDSGRSTSPQGGGTPTPTGPNAPGDPGTSDVRFDVDAATTFAISPFIYGVNFYGEPADQYTPAWASNLRMSRMGGNRLTAYNWENNASNAGSDYNYQNDAYLGGGDTPGQAVRMRIDAARSHGAGIIVTVPMIGYVARDKNGTSVGTDPATLQTRLATRFVQSVPRKASAFTLTPDLNDNYVYQDEFVNWVDKTYPGSANATAAQPIFFSLDNEPDAWGGTHEEIRSKVNGEEQLLTYDGLINTTIAYASAIKSVVPHALVFGPVMATYTGVVNLGRYPSPDPVYGTQNFTDVYLNRLHAAESSAGQRLVDVYDLHWYPAGGTSDGTITNDGAPQTAAMINARLQAPRSLWDSTYDEHSWVTQYLGGPIALLPRLRGQIAAHYPGTKLAITEYYYGRGGDISGGLAQADVLGIFGREGLFAATLWANADVGVYGNDATRAYAYVNGAFDLFRNYDGQQHAFGDVGMKATTSDPTTSSVYASTDVGNASRVVLVVLNKSSSAQRAGIALASPTTYSHAEAYVMRDGSPTPTRGTDVPITAHNAFVYTMPPTSATTLVLVP